MRTKTALTFRQVHADASNFAENVTKQEAYEQVLQQAAGLFDGQRNWYVWALPCLQSQMLLMLTRKNRVW